MSATIKDLKDSEVVVPTTSPFNSTLWLVRKTGDYQNINQDVIAVAAAVPNVVSLFKQINISSGMWYVAIDSVNAHKDHHKQFAFSYPCRPLPLQFYLKDVLTLLPLSYWCTIW